jgi:aldehyde:ferredoxin oxidoreductase
MTRQLPGGYTGKQLRVDLSKGLLSKENLDTNSLRHFIGGTGLGMKLLYDEVIPGTQWYDPDNRLIIATGPLNGTQVGGSGGFSVVCKGALTNGATSVQAMGFMGAYLKFCGFDAIVIHGSAPRLVYLYIDGQNVELKDAQHLAGKDTWETERIVKSEHGGSERDLSVFSIGPAGENLVRFACLVGDRGHVAAHNGVGAVMGSKKLKAIAVARGENRPELDNQKELSNLAKKMFDQVTNQHGFFFNKLGTLGPRSRQQARIDAGTLPIRNYNTNVSPEFIEFNAENVRAQTAFEMQWQPCWACKFRHCHKVRIIDGPFAGYVGEEPEYELWAGFGPLIGNKELAGALALANDADRLGLDGNESSWLIAWIMDCYQAGIFREKDIDGLEMNWGNVESSRVLLKKIADREGIGNILANGIKAVAEQMGGEARQLAIYTKKGNTPRMHDHRGSWAMMIDTCTSDTGTDAYCPVAVAPTNKSFPPFDDPLSPDSVARTLASTTSGHPFYPFSDSLVICQFNKWGVDSHFLADLVRAATGYDFAAEEVSQVGLRIANMFRCFNLRHGLKRDMEVPSPKYCSIPADGPHKGISIMPIWNEIVDKYYELLGWEKNSGKPLPETLEKLGLARLVNDIW